MDRPIIYPGEVPAVDDLLYGWQRSMVALSRLAQAVFGKGGGTWVDGFQVTPGAGLTVTVPPGQIYQLNPVDPNGYGALPDDTSQILQQFLNDSYSSFNVPAPTTSGQSIDYLIQFTPVTEDEGSLVLQYFDVANPNVALGGPNNSGESQPTQRLNTVQVELISGTPGTTGQQVAPSLSGSAVAGFVVTVAYGQTSIAQSNITVADGSAPFLTLKLPAAAGTEISNTFTQTQTMQKNLVVQGTATVEGSIAGASTGYINTGLTVGWNFTDGQGEVDLLLGPQGGAGGLNMYQLDSSGNMVSTTPIFGLTNGGNLTLPGYLTISMNGSTGSSMIGLKDTTSGQTTPNKYIRSNSGEFQVVNSAYSAAILALTDDGDLSVPGTVSCANATANNNAVPLGQLNSLIPQLFASVNNVTGSRSLGVTYTNNTGKPMFVSVVGVSTGGGSNFNFFVNGILTFTFGQPNTSSETSTMGMVPPGATYEVTNTVSGINVQSWVEIY